MSESGAISQNAALGPQSCTKGLQDDCKDMRGQERQPFPGVRWGTAQRLWAPRTWPVTGLWSFTVLCPGENEAPRFNSLRGDHIPHDALGVSSVQGDRNL